MSSSRRCFAERWENEGGSVFDREAVSGPSLPRYLTDPYAANGRWFASLADVLSAAKGTAVGT